MQYHIQTAPVWDAYRGDGCPLCRIYNAKQKKLVTAYLNENVMDPDFRVRQNPRGFCRFHTDMLYAGENKLGLALQTETRAEYLCRLVGAPQDKKSAKKTAAALRAHIGCVICDELNEFMPRYYMTIAQMFAQEQEFKDLFASASHCAAHTAELYDAAEHAGRSAPAYLAALTAAFKRDMQTATNELRAFCDCFDHNSKARPDSTVLPRSIALLLGGKD